MIKCEPQKMLGTEKYGIYHDSRFSGMPEPFRKSWPVIVNVVVEDIDKNIELYDIDLVGIGCVDYLKKNFVKRNGESKLGNISFLYAKLLKNNIFQLICYTDKNNDPIFISYSAKAGIFADNLKK